MNKGEMNKRACLYARVSSDEQAKGYSLATQLEACRKYCEGHGFEVVGEFSDEFTGASLDRPGLDRLRGLIATDRISEMVVYDLDRLSRKAVYQMLLEEEFGKKGVRVHYVLGQYDDTPEGQLQKQIKAAIAEYEREKVKERSVRGKLGKARAGYVVGNGLPPYGYRYEGEAHKGMLVICEEEARIVRLIFEWFVHGDGDSSPLSCYMIAKKLSEMRVLTWADRWMKWKKRKKEPGVWHSSTVRSILANETYAGTWYYNRWRRSKNKKRLRPRGEWIPVEVPVIISRELWELAQRQLAANRHRTQPKARRKYLLKGMLKCSVCGGTLCGVTYRCRKEHKGKIYNYKNSYYICHGTSLTRSHNFKDQDCTLRSVPREAAEAAVWGYVARLLQEPAMILEGLRCQQEEARSANRALEERVALFDDQIANCERQIELLLDDFLLEEFPRAVLADRKRALDEQLAQLQQERDNITARLEQQEITEAQIQDIEEFCTKVSQGLRRLTFREKRKILELLNVQGIVEQEPDGKKVKHKIRLTGYFPAAEEFLTVKQDMKMSCATVRKPIAFGATICLGLGVAKEAEICYTVVAK